MKLTSTSSRALTNHRMFLIFFLLILSICTPAWPLAVTQTPSLTMDPNGVTPLAGVVQFTTDIPARVTLNISNGLDTSTKEFAVYQTDHSLPILGLKPNNVYSIEIIITDEENNQLTLSPVLQAVTDPLPDDIPDISVPISDPERMEPGYTLLDIFVRTARRIPTNQTPDGTLPTYSIILDNTGEVVWYSTLGSRDMKQLPNGNLQYFTQSEIFEIDLLGGVQKVIHLQVSPIHHEVFTRENGNILSLTLDDVAVDDYPSSYTDPNAPTQNATIIDNPVIEFSSNGVPLNRWRLSDIVDPKRIGYDSLNIPYSDGHRSWAHANAVIHDPSDDSIIVSLRHQDAVIKFSRLTGTLKWILGNHNNWPPALQPFLLTPVGMPFEWQFHQHAPEITPSGNILLFDNGNHRASPFDGTEPLTNRDNYSRAVEYSINEQSMKIRQVWEYGSQVDQRYFSNSVSDVDWLKETGNILITYGDVQYVAGASSESLGTGVSHIRIVEVDHHKEADKVFEVILYNTTPQSVIMGYRSERIPDLYPIDTDNDGVSDYQDNCLYSANGPLIPDSGGNSQRDSDNDGFGNVCDADLNNDGQTNSQDLGLLRLAFLTQASQPNFNPDADLNGDGLVNSLDLGIINTLFSQPPGPSGSVAQ